VSGAHLLSLQVWLSINKSVWSLPVEASSLAQLSHERDSLEGGTHPEEADIQLHLRARYILQQYTINCKIKVFKS